MVRTIESNHTKKTQTLHAPRVVKCTLNQTAHSIWTSVPRQNDCMRLIITIFMQSLVVLRPVVIVVVASSVASKSLNAITFWHSSIFCGLCVHAQQTRDDTRYDGGNVFSVCVCGCFDIARRQLRCTSAAMSGSVLYHACSL